MPNGVPVHGSIHIKTSNEDFPADQHNTIIECGKRPR